MFDQIPMDRIHVMQVIVRKFFPDYLEAYNDLGGANLLITVAFDLSREQWELVKDIYIRWCSYGDAEGMARLILQMQTALKLT
jgi:hypothetical protein